MLRDFVMLHDRDGCHHSGHNKTKQLVHLIFVTKYRKAILAGDLRNAVKQQVFESAKRHHWYIDTMETVSIRPMTA